MSNFTEILPTGATLLHAEGQTDGYNHHTCFSRLHRRVLKAGCSIGAGSSLQIDTVKAFTRIFVEKLILGALPKESRPVEPALIQHGSCAMTGHFVTQEH